MKNIGAVLGPEQAEDIYNLNYGCSPSVYKLAYDTLGPSHNGCFTATAFGMMDVSNNVVEGYGFDGAIPVKPVGKQAMVPIPKSGAIATMSAAPLVGVYFHIYTAGLGNASLQYDFSAQPYLQMPAAPNITFSDSTGQPLAINSQSIAYSMNGSWLVVESPWHSFLRINLATLEMLPFAPSFNGEPFDYKQHAAQVAISDDGRYIAVQSDEFGTFKVYDLATCTGAITNDLQPLACQSHDYAPYVASQIKDWHLTRHLRFINDSLLSFHATGSDGPQLFELAPASSITNLTQYLALGDSYSSGEGAFSYVAGTDTANNKCHQSLVSYPYLLTRDMFDDGHSVACSGAVIEDIDNTDSTYRGQVNDNIARKNRTSDSVNLILNNFLPGYIAQQEFVSRYQPRILTVGISGNDIGFADIIKTCISPLTIHNNCYGSYEDQEELLQTIQAVKPRLVALYHELQSSSPSSQVYAIGYPQVLAVGSCGLNVHLSQHEVLLSQGIVSALNDVINQAADEAGITYIDISHALDGHRLCEAGSGSVAVNGLTAGDDNFHIIGNESYHPNALGHELIEQAILHQTNNFAAAALHGEIPTSDPMLPLPNAPKTGRPISTVLLANSITPSEVIARGQSAAISVGASQAALKPNTSYTVKLHGSDATLGALASDSNGSVSAAVTIPEGTAVGNQSLDITGPNFIGQPVTVSQAVFIANSTSDFDGDGALNASDSCPLATNAGQDSDQDGIDDVCDGSIGTSASIINGQRPSGGNGDSSPVPNNSSQIANTVTIAPDISSSERLSGSFMQASSSGANGAVLGTEVSSKNSPAIEKAQAPTTDAFARGNPKLVDWQPWAVDAGLVLGVLTILSVVFGRLAK